ncbi:MAG: PAS domain-containing protein [Candidatus Caenarcaniphilales bacterium]|nr:PAS domain-containing protein [Candidatus Caenarcaniphilales bacterium]
MSIPPLSDEFVSKELKNFALESTSCGVAIADMLQEDQPLIYVNKGFEKVTGYLRDEVIGRNCKFLQGDDTDQPQLELLRHCLKEGEDCVVVLKNYRKDGTLFYNELYLSPIKDKTGKTTHFVGVQNDVTRREILGQELAKHKSNKIAVKDYEEGSIRLLSPEQIIYIERQSRQVVIHTKEKDFPTYFTIEKLEKRLSHCEFYKANKGALINLNYIEHMIPNGDGTYDIVLKDKREAEITASRSGSKSILKDLQVQ